VSLLLVHVVNITKNLWSHLIDGIGAFSCTGAAGVWQMKHSLLLAWHRQAARRLQVA